ncbi:hypothetical protein HELRODRAFT_189201 [Helobdella robusta]|uniref:Integrin beta n=1 Tax=Helobdella robusta TaxID=6412 RepID=T1FQS2_HELRO|nr:hypothetical protein HELRODRAFT_189201 [Helobdella robusta]ESN96336.1 hypothetical protein HELRODRAFT_189201 [Helobdella robusta]
MAKDYPVEIYFLIDSSFTMESYKEDLSKAVDQLVSRLHSISNNVKLGLGVKIMTPQKDGSMQLHKLYSARLTGFFLNLKTFDLNFDKEHIGWSEKARKMIIVLTDAKFHTAGDGKLAGITEPNDLQCHLNSTGFYTQDREQDYPSVGQLIHLFETSQIHLMTFVKGFQDEYKRLTKYLPNSIVGNAFSDSNNMYQFIVENYENIHSSVNLQFIQNDKVDIQMRSQCNTDNKWIKGGHCRNVKIGQKVSFELTISTNSCDPQTIYIHPAGLHEKVKINIQPICDCRCQINLQRNHSVCNMHGDAVCGSCQCHEGYYGDKCQCFTERSALQLVRCVRTEAHVTVECVRANQSGQVIHLNFSPAPNASVTTMIVNKYRDECATVGSNNLPRTHSNDDRRCKINLVYYSGKGTCHCGKCQCRPGFSGSACDCPTSNKTCLASNGDLCNGVGECNCGVCQCAKDRPFIGDTCEECPTCSDDVCQEHEFCASCFFEPDDHICHSECSTNIHPVNQLPEMSANQIFCESHTTKCTTKFIYDLRSSSIVLQTKKECVSELMIIGSVVGGVAMIGVIMLVVWKVVVTVHDNKEYKKFEMERKIAKWATASNPLYKSAVTKFINPAFRE